MLWPTGLQNHIFLIQCDVAILTLYCDMLKHLYWIILNMLLSLFCLNVSAASLSFLPLYPCYCEKILVSDHLPLTGFSSVMQYFLLNFAWGCLWIFIKYLVNIGVLK